MSALSHGQHHARMERGGIDNVSIVETTASTGVGILFDWVFGVVNKSN